MRNTSADDGPLDSHRRSRRPLKAAVGADHLHEPPPKGSVAATVDLLDAVAAAGRLHEPLPKPPAMVDSLDAAAAAATGRFSSSCKLQLGAKRLEARLLGAYELGFAALVFAPVGPAPCWAWQAASHDLAALNAGQFSGYCQLNRAISG